MKKSGSDAKSSDQQDGTAEGNDKEASNATRHFFDGEESCYVIDAKLEGNVGRYLNVSHEEYSEGIVCWIVCPDCILLISILLRDLPTIHLMLFFSLQHSCQPNLFAQNVFVDTHDLRFPWVAFFASKLVTFCYDIIYCLC